MKIIFITIFIVSCLASSGQTLHLSSLQHEIRWLEEVRFPPFVTDAEVQDSLLHYTARTLAKQCQAADFTHTSGIAYRNITGFGKPKMNPPAASSNPLDYEASVYSLITRATYGLEVFWSMKVDVQQQGRSVFSREINHELLNYASEPAWFDAEIFVATFIQLLDELLELGPPLAPQLVLGGGINYDSVLHARSDVWMVKKNRNILGLGAPDFGPYTTIAADKVDTSVIKTSKKLGTDWYIGTEGSGWFFDQYKTYDYSKTKFYYLHLGSTTDTMRASFAVITQKRESQRTIAGMLFGGNNNSSTGQLLAYDRQVLGTMAVDSVVWEFHLDNCFSGSAICSGAMLAYNAEYLLQYVQHAGFSREIVLKNNEGELFASLASNFSETMFLIRKDIDSNTQKAIAIFYAILMSINNLP